MKITNQNGIKFKDGNNFLVGTEINLTFNGSTIATIEANGKSYKIKCSSLPRYFTKFKVPSLRTMENWSNDGIAKSMLGKRVEPDGYDDEGSPSWMLVAGII